MPGFVVRFGIRVAGGGRGGAYEHDIVGRDVADRGVFVGGRVGGRLVRGPQALMFEAAAVLGAAETLGGFGAAEADGFGAMRLATDTGGFFNFFTTGMSCRPALFSAAAKSRVGFGGAGGSTFGAATIFDS